MNTDFIKTGKAALKNIYQNKFAYYSKAVFLQLFLSTAGIFIIRFLFRLTLISSGQDNLSMDNFFEILANPLSLILLVLLVLSVCLLIFFEFSVLTLMVYYSYKNGNFSWIRNFRNALLNFSDLNLKEFVFFILYFILMIPLSNLGLSSIFTERLFIPKFITGELVKTNSGKALYFTFLLLCAYINLRLIFSIPLTVINKLRLSENMKKSMELTKKEKCKFLLPIIIFELLLTLISALSLSAASFIFTTLDKSGGQPVYNIIFYILARVILFFFFVFTKLAIISVVVKIIIDNEGSSLDTICYEKKEINKYKFLSGLVSLVLVLSLAYKGYNLFLAPLNKNVLVIGHRGYTQFGVENSLEALAGAAKVGADYVEADILLTKDNKFVVIHDFKLKRLAKLNKKVRDMNFDELVGLKIGQGEFTSYLPSLEEFVNKAKELNIKLLLELKPYGNEPDNYTELFINELKRLGVEKEYKVMSLNREIMEKIETEAPEIETGYVIPLQLGLFEETDIDFFVIEDFSFNEVLSEQAQNEGKDIFVWTINSPDLMAKYLHEPVNGIISDFPDLIKQEIQREETDNSYFDKLYRLVNIGF